MKFKAPFACLVATTCLFAACSDSSTSGGTSDSTSAKRVKNEALTVVAPVIDKIESGDSSLTVFVSLPDGSAGNVWFYQVSAPAGAANPVGSGTENVDNAPASFTIDGLTNGATYTIRVAHWNNDVSEYVSATGTPGLTSSTSAQVATTTTVASTTTTRTTACRAGGDCTIGDTGPGGGVVFFDAGSVQPWGRYLEVAPEDLAATQFGCTGTVLEVANSDLGGGFGNSFEVSSSFCSNNTAAQLAYTYRLAGSTGWYLPSKVELNELCKYANNQPTGDTKTPCTKGASLRASFSPTFYWSSTQIDANFASYQSFVTGQQFRYGKPATAVVRPIRAFANKDGVTVPTTVPIAKCNRGGECKVGDTGPGGGLVFYVAPTPQPWGQYMEITSNPVHSGGWGCDSSAVPAEPRFGFGRSNTQRLVGLGCAGAIAAENHVSSTGVDDWFLPSFDELTTAAQAKMLVVPSGSSGAFSSTTDGGCFQGYGCFMKTVASDGSSGSTANGFYTSTVVHAVRTFGKVG